MTPNRDHIRQWAEALESGEYQQGRTVLREGDRWCCLGVACDLAGIEGVEQERGEWYYDGHRSDLPAGAQEWLGLNQSSPTVRSGGLLISLATLNDKGVTFPEIAALIRKEWLS